MTSTQDSCPREVFHEERRRKGGTGAHYRTRMEVSEEGICAEEEGEELEEC
ncbi:hypothetical protein ABVT39_006932 [Epinephelus coioides]